jgi:solute carrier family 25 protein 38
VFTPFWIEKHQKHVPCLLIAFFDFTSDANLNSLNDNQLKSEINGLRNALSQSEYKTRFAVVLLSDKTILEAPDIEDRLATIRRATGLDPKSGLFFLPPNTSRVEVSSFVTSILTTLQPQCIEYYRDLTKHSRRKKNRGNAPPPTIPPTRTSSQPLSNHGWGIRYDVKLGTFAEFRQEMEAACRHYTSALESLMSPDGTLETTASWSPRWAEARLLADMMAFRIIRCLLWSQLSTTAAQSWINYRDRMRELVDRRGKGSANYGWEAWESRWAKLMAELIQRADIPALSITDSIDMTASTLPSKSSENTTFLPPEKAIPVGERLAPWNHLHHPGYWMRLSARSAKRRRRYALEIPEEDRAPPSQSPASAVANRQRTYDLYLALEPHIESPISAENGFSHEADIIERLDSASRLFSERNQTRFADRLRLEIAREYLRKGDFNEATKLLKALWQGTMWRKEKWWLPLFELTRTLSECAHSVGNVPTLVGTLFELHSPQLRFFKEMKLDLMSAGKGLPPREDDGNEKPVVKLSPESVISFC